MLTVAVSQEKIAGSETNNSEMTRYSPLLSRGFLVYWVGTDMM
jgi:hypothetical protein